MAASGFGHPRRRQDAPRASVVGSDRTTVPSHRTTSATHRGPRSGNRSSQGLRRSLRPTASPARSASRPRLLRPMASGPARRNAPRPRICPFTRRFRGRRRSCRPVRRLLRRDPFVVQDLIVQTHNTRYVLETWRTPAGALIRGELPAGFAGISAPGLLTFMLQQHYAAHVPQSRLLEELRDYGVDISAGQVNNILTEHHEAFHAEKDALLPTALQVFTSLVRGRLGGAASRKIRFVSVHRQRILHVVPQLATPKSGASSWTCCVAATAITCSTSMPGRT